MKGYHLLTLSHRQASFEEIGRIVLPETVGVSLGDRLSALKNEFGWDELLYLATCNRVIFFFYTKNEVTPRTAHQFLAALRPDLTSCPPACLALKMGLFSGISAIEHLFDVTASIDSLVVGEREIFRQLREAEERCKSWGITGDHIRLAMRFAVVAAKDVYSNTKIAEKNISIVSLAVHQMRAAGLNPKSRILMIGAGQTNQLLAKFLQKEGIESVTVFNRTLEKAAEIAAVFPKGKAHLLADLQKFTDGFDQMIVCTSSPKILINEAVFSILKNNENGQKVVVDLSVPANVSSALNAEKNTQLIDIEQLKHLAEQNMAARGQEVSAARKILNQHLSDYKKSHRQRQMERALDFLPDEMRHIRERALDVYQKDIAKLDPEAQKLIENILFYVEKKSVGVPMRAVKELVGI
jgi:glutamyl-tRNA reductase